jgi:hypothetical protein
MKQVLFFFAFALVSATLITSCKKDSISAISTSTEEMAMSQDDLEQIDADADQIVDERGGSGTCPTLTWDNPAGTWPNRLVIDFGTNCTRPDGRVVSGKIIVVQSAEMREAGAVRTITFDGFKVDDVLFAGERTRTNNGLNTSGQPSHTTTANNVTRTFTDGTSTSHTATHTFTMVAGFNTPNVRLDDAFEITGTGTFVGRGGDEFVNTILTPLRKENLCRWIVSGTASITRNGETGTIDFGTGNCDRDAVVTGPNGNTRTIRLRR